MIPAPPPTAVTWPAAAPAHRSYPATSAEDCREALCEASALAPFFARLRAARDGAVQPVRILQLGDSHTANDNITGAWRTLLQARYGDAGRGVLPPGRPYAGYVTRQVTVAQSPDWVSIDTLQAERTHQRLSFGLAGQRLTSTAPGAGLTLQADPGHEFDTAEVCAEASPGAPTLEVVLGDQQRELVLDAPNTGARCLRVESAEAEQHVRLIAKAAGVTLLSWSSSRRGPGVLVSNLGVVGAGLRHLAPGGDIDIQPELTTYAPDLIVLEYGVNDGFGETVDIDAYATTLQNTIARLQRLAPSAPILLLEAPDAQRRTGLAGWQSPAGLVAVRAAQERVAREAHVALWRWADFMGGQNAAEGWVKASPPRMRPDHVHFTAAGGVDVAQALDADLEAAAARSEAP